jgi:predicted ATP-dependent endonuclease of OLD family
MRDLLFELAGLSCQIIATTHSPYMINLGSEKSVSLVKFALDNEELAVCSSFNLESAFQSLQRDEKQNLKMLLKIDDYISRLFFSKKCIFIEGDTEDIIIRETNRRLNDVDKARVIGNCEFLRARGKAVLISVAKYLNALEINYMIMHDRDAGTERAEAMNDPILEQTGENRRIMVEECIENIIGYDAPTYEKPFKAYKYIEENWGDTFDELPQAWRVIFLKLCSPYLDHLIQNN